MEGHEVVGDPLGLVHSGVLDLLLYHTLIEGGDGVVQHIVGREVAAGDTLGLVLTGDHDHDGVVSQPRDGDVDNL